MKDHLRQPCVLTELCKLFEDDSILAGASIGKCHNQIEVLILVAQEAFQLVLGLLPFPQDVGKRFSAATPYGYWNRFSAFSG